MPFDEDYDSWEQPVMYMECCSNCRLPIAYYMANGGISPDERHGNDMSPLCWDCARVELAKVKPEDAPKQ